MTSLKARLTKAKARLFGTATTDIAVPFELPCDCGHRVAGIRRASYQIATCTACDARVYVLPVNVYPATKRVRSEVLDGSVTSRLGEIMRDLVVGEQASPSGQQSSATPSSTSKSVAASGPRRSGLPSASDAAPAEDVSADGPKKSGKRSRRSHTQTRISPAAAVLVADPILADEPVVRVPRPSLVVVMRRIFTPFRLLMLSAALLVAATGWWIVTQRQLEVARKTWRQEMDVAERALDDQDLVALHDSLSKAVAAANTLQRDDADSRRAMSLLLQTQAVQDLSSVDLIVSLSGCMTGEGAFNTAKATAVAESLNGKWFVFECSLQRSENGLKADIPLIVDTVPVTITILSDAMQRAMTALPQSPLMFVASVESCHVDAGGREFQIQLSGKSSTLITTEYHAAQLGFNAANTPGLNALLERQGDFLRTASAGKDGKQ